MAVTHDLLSGMPLVLIKIELIRLWNSLLPEPGQPSAQLSRLIRLTACKKAMHAISRWYRTVYIPVYINVQEQGTKFLSGKRLENIDAGRHYDCIFFSDMLAIAVFQV